MGQSVASDTDLTQRQEAFTKRRAEEQARLNHQRAQRMKERMRTSEEVRATKYALQTDFEESTKAKIEELQDAAWGRAMEKRKQVQERLGQQQLAYLEKKKRRQVQAQRKEDERKAQEEAVLAAQFLEQQIAAQNAAQNKNHGINLKKLESKNSLNSMASRKHLSDMQHANIEHIVRQRRSEAVRAKQEVREEHGE